MQNPKAMPPVDDQTPAPGTAAAQAIRRYAQTESLALTRADVEIAYACCGSFNGFASRVRAGFGWGAIGWVTDQGPAHYATESFILSHCPFCGAKLRGPDGETLDRRGRVVAARTPPGATRERSMDADGDN